MNDNRNYHYLNKSVSNRPEYPIISKMLVNRGNIIDLGCGDGSLLLYLKKKNIIEKGIGVEISSSGTNASRKKGFKTFKMSIDKKLPFKDKEFDYAICNVTLQMVMYPEILINEMVKISEKQIITFPNFASLLNRLELLFCGRMPQFMIPGYKWYSTGHVHQLSIKDFKNYCRDNNIKILRTNHIYPDRLFVIPKIILKIFPNLFASTGVFLTSRGNEKE